MSGPGAAAVPYRVTAVLRRPPDLVGRARWLFFLCAVASLLVVVMGSLPAATPASLALALCGAVALTVSWQHRYRTGRVGLFLDGTDQLAVAAIALACPQPAMSIGTVFAGLWFRSVYGSTPRVVAYGLGQATALSAAALTAHRFPWHDPHEGPGMVLGALPVLLLTLVVARHLALGLLEREKDQERDVVLAALGGQLLGVTDRRQILRTAWRTAEAVCRMTPGLGAAVLHEDGDTVRVVGSAGSLRRPPATLPREVLPAGGADGEVCEISAPPELVAAAGFRGQWLLLPMPDEPGAHMLLGAPGAVPREVVVAGRSMVNQVALALRTSQAHSELQAQALTDGLTGLANRTAFSAAMAAALHTRGCESWVLFLDLDDFKRVNDTLGHLAGDRLLTHLGDALTRTLRGTDVCARLGGDEFAVLLPGSTEADAQALGRRLVELISTPVELPEGTARIGASIGATRVRPGATETEVVHEADVAMYAAKAAGKNRVRFFSPALLATDEPITGVAGLRAIEDDELVGT